MQTSSNLPAIVATVETATVPNAPVATVSPATDAPAPNAPVAVDAPAKPKRSRAKPVAAKPAKPAVIAAPATDASKPAADTSAERIAARDAIRGYYGGSSLPLKAASDTFALYRTDKQPKRATERQAALLATIILLSSDIDKRGAFTRGGLQHDGKAVQPETGCLSDMHGRVISHVSGPLVGKQARDARFRINLKLARSEISALLGDKLGKLAIAKIDKLAA